MFDSHRVRKMQNHFSQPPHNSHCTQRSLSEEMRARLPTTNKNAEEDGNIDVERHFNINGNDDDFDSSGAMKKKKSVSSSSLPSMMMVPKNPWLLLVLGILFGAFLPTFMKHKSVRIVHKHVKGAYKAHSEASKEYLKRYRETYLEEVKANVNNAETVMILESTVKEEEKKVEEELVKEEVGAVTREEGGDIAFKTLENGKHVCLPLIYEDFSDLVSEEEMNESGTVMTRSECEWFARYIKVSIVASKMTSKCVPDDHVFSTLVNEHEWEVFTYAVQNVKSEKCLIDRLIILCLDEATALKCKYDGFTHCVQYVDTLGASDFMQNEYWRIVWLKTKMALALVSAKLTAFIHDSDVLFLKVPDMDRIIALDPTAEMFHQWEQLNYTALFLKSSFEEESEPVDVPHKGLNSGQIVYLPTEKVHQGLLLSLRKGKEWGTNKNRLEQELLMSGMDDVGVKRTGLSYKYNSYCSTRSFNREHEHLEEWITFHVNCAKGPGLKMHHMREVQEDWIKHKSG